MGPTGPSNEDGRYARVGIAMIHGLLIGTLALMSSTTLLTPGGEPDDPYQWLEEVLGEKPLAWVKERNAESDGRAALDPSSFAALDHRILEILDSDARIPAIRKIGPYYYNFWRDAREPARALAAHHARRVPQGQARLGNRARSRRSRQGRERSTGSGRGPRRSSPTTSWPSCRSRAGVPTRASCANST